MPVTVDTTVGGPSANSYASVAEFDAYTEGHPKVSAVTAASDDQKGRALIMATSRIDQEQFLGTPAKPLNGTSTAATQALKFPRFGVASDEGWTYSETVIPEPVKKATMELALEVLAGGISLTDTGLEGFAEVKLGPLNVTPRQSRSAGRLPSHVLRFISVFMVTPSSRSFGLERA